MESLRQYIYMDTNNIDSLLNQITQESIKESSIKTTKHKSGSIKGNLGFSNLVKSLFNSDISMTGEAGSTQEISKTFTQPYEAKIQQIREYVEKHQILLKSKDEITEKYEDDKQNFIYCTMYFDTDFDYKNWDESVNLAKKIGYISFYKGKPTDDTYQYHDSYYKMQITMNLGINNMSRFGGITSHLAFLFRAMQGKDINLGVFGHIYKLLDNCYQIKPYAVWRE